MTNNTELIEIDLFQLHYYLKDGSHSLDATSLNKVEAEFLKLSKEVSKIFDCELFIESFALEEGGIKSIYKFLTDKKNLKYTIPIGVFLSGIIGNIITNVASNIISEDKEQIELTKELTKLQIEELKESKKKADLEEEKQKLEIKKLKQEIILDSIEISKSLNNPQEELQVEIDKNILDKKLTKVVDSTKIKTYKSNFYKILSNNNKVLKISTQILSKEGFPITQEKFVDKTQFKNFIYIEEPIEPKYLNNIELEIISPVLKNKKLSWKAIYDGKTISFSVKDEDFKNLIENKGLSFNNGTKLICDLEIKLKRQPDDSLKETSKTVYNVTQIKYPDGDVVDV